MGATSTTLHCPKCRRGEKGHLPVGKGIVQSGRIKPSRKGKTLSTMRESKCLDCGHVWWSKVFSIINYAKFKNAEV